MSGMDAAETLKSRAIATLRANDRGGYTVPTARLYPYQWNWDAGFTALGWSTFDEARAWQELEMLFLGQWHDGLLPHIVFHQQSPDYFPGPDVWATGERAAVPTSGISQPPITATIVRWLLAQARDLELAEARAAELYPKLIAHHCWWQTARDPEGTGLVCTYHPWETGRDNSAEWDRPLGAVPETETRFERLDTALVNESERPHASEYRRYIHLLEVFSALDYRPDALYSQSPFKVADVGINAIRVRAEQDLLVLGQRFGSPDERAAGEARLELARNAFARLWNPALHCFNGCDLRAGRTLDLPISAGYLALFSGLANESQAGAMAAELQRWHGVARYLVPSLAPDHPQFEPRRYWRGPAWSMLSFMIASGLADYGFGPLAERIRADVRALTERGGFHEYFDPVDGRGCGGVDFSWTAAIALWWGLSESE